MPQKEETLPLWDTLPSTVSQVSEYCDKQATSNRMAEKGGLDGWRVDWPNFADPNPSVPMPIFPSSSFWPQSLEITADGTLLDMRQIGIPRRMFLRRGAFVTMILWSWGELGRTTQWQEMTLLETGTRWTCMGIYCFTPHNSHFHRGIVPYSQRVNKQLEVRKSDCMFLIGAMRKYQAFSWTLGPRMLWVQRSAVYLFRILRLIPWQNYVGMP